MAPRRVPGQVRTSASSSRHRTAGTNDDPDGGHRGRRTGGGERGQSVVGALVQRANTGSEPTAAAAGVGASPVCVLSGISFRNKAVPAARIVVTTPIWNAEVTPMVNALWIPATMFGMIG